MSHEELVQPNYPTEKKVLANGVIDVLPSDKNYEEDKFFAYYDKEYETYYEDLGLPDAREKAHQVNTLLSDEERKKIDKVLDIGCGPGVFLDEFSKLVNAKVSVGTDLSSYILNVASKEAPGHLFVRADSHYLPFADNAFDAACLIDVVEHLPDEDKLLQEAGRVAQKIIVKVPLERCLFFWLQSKLMSVDWKKTRGHINFYTKKSFIGLMERNGFTLVRSFVPKHSKPHEWSGGILFKVYSLIAWLAAYLPEPIYRALVITELVALFERKNEELV